MGESHGMHAMVARKVFGVIMNKVHMRLKSQSVRTLRGTIGRFTKYTTTTGDKRDGYILESLQQDKASVDVGKVTIKVPHPRDSTEKTIDIEAQKIDYTGVGAPLAAD